MRTFLLVFVFLTTLLLCIRRYLCVIHVQGLSMSPALQHGDRVVVVCHWPRRWLRHNQIVLVERDADVVVESLPPGVSVEDLELSKELVVKRLIALPYETVVTLHTEDGEQSESITWHIPGDHGFVKGDGVVSVDSVQWGPIPLSSIRGVVVGTLPSRHDTTVPEVTTDHTH
ncbi:MAG: S26 family signal peptidase [Chloroflexota bacterium]